MSGDIPQDIMAAAEDAYLQAIYMTDSDEPGNMVQMVAKAVLAERERCATIADAWGDLRPMPDDGPIALAATDYGSKLVRVVAAAIRKGEA